MIRKVLHTIRTALIYLCGRTWNLVVDRLLEAAIIALLALAAGIPWFAQISHAFSAIFHCCL